MTGEITDAMTIASVMKVRLIGCPPLAVLGAQFCGYAFVYYEIGRGYHWFA